jgi:hypothetical protein
VSVDPEGEGRRGRQPQPSHAGQSVHEEGGVAVSQAIPREPLVQPEGGLPPADNRAPGNPPVQGEALSNNPVEEGGRRRRAARSRLEWRRNQSFTGASPIGDVCG